MVGLQRRGHRVGGLPRVAGLRAERPQGRPPTSRDPTQPQVPIIEHADVRRMLLRQKAIVEGGLALAAHRRAPGGPGRATREDEATRRAGPAAARPAHAGGQDASRPRGASRSNALAVQIHGGYGYSSEYLPEAWLRDQKLNSIHEGTTGIQGLDLLGRKVVAAGRRGAARPAREEIAAARGPRAPAGVARQLVRARSSGPRRGGRRSPPSWAPWACAARWRSMLRHSADYLRAVLHRWWSAGSGWSRRRRPPRARPAGGAGRDFYEGKLCAAQYFLLEELPLVEAYVERCRAGEDSYALIRPESF